MLSRLREHLGGAGLIVAIVALVAALSGAAIAANGGSGDGQATASAKAKKGPRGPKGAKGDTGPAGPQGPAGPAGAKGDAGAAGSNGNNGADGAKGATGATGPSGTAGTKGATGPTGADGSPWVVGTAPSGVILKGTWSIPQYTAAAAGENIPVPISTGVPVPTGSMLMGAVGAGLDNGEFEEFVEAVCPGSAANPTINAAAIPGEEDKGALCIYAEAQTNLVPPGTAFEGPSWQVQGSGGVVSLFQSEAAGDAGGYGSWAMLTQEAE